MSPARVATGAAVLGALVGLACADAPAGDPRPDIVLVVIDTVRADAVSAYGQVAGTTPHLDALAAAGLLYHNAFAPSPWTLPSHATLFTGLAPERHGVGLHGRVALPDGPPTLAEQLRRAGYETVGFSENPLVASQLGFGRGFDHFESEADTAALRAKVDPDIEIDVPRGVRTWGSRRDASKPYFLFVNLIEAHDPYDYHLAHDFLSPGADREKARRLDTGGSGKGVAEALGICDHLPSRETLRTVRGLYLGEVAAVDAQLDAVLAALPRATRPRPPITLVTSDHGEHLGEHALLGHEFSLHDEVLRVPLVVHGAPGASPGTAIETPVALGDLPGAVLAWAGVDPDQTLPLQDVAPTPPRVLTSVFSDAEWVLPDGARSGQARESRRRRAGCGPGDRVFGDLLAAIDGRWKLIWYAEHAPRLFDRSWDRAEKSDVSERHPDVVAGLTRHLEPLREKLAEATDALPLDPAAAEALRALGYAD